jgi:hypothetical protein
VEWIENAYELLDEEGEWYLNRSTDELYYIPRSGEDMGTVQAYIPILETLVDARDLQNTTFRGMVFAHATWLGPNSSRGYTELQATYQWGGLPETPANITFTASRDIIFEDNIFTHLGAGGLKLAEGCKNINITGNVFRDISANGIHVSNLNPRPGGDNEVRGVSIINNYITKAGNEYTSACAVFAGYTADLTVEHNEIHDVGWIGVHIGWGWGQDSYAENNNVRYNHIYDHMLYHDDGGGVYFLSPNPNSEISYNYIHDQVHELGALYPDQGTAYTHWHHNVIQNVVRWLHIWQGSIHDNTVNNNYSDNTTITNNGTNNDISNNTFVLDGNWPQEALDIMAGAGLEPEYLHIREKQVGHLTAVNQQRNTVRPLECRISGNMLFLTRDNGLPYVLTIHDLRGRKAASFHGRTSASFALPEIPPGIYTVILQDREILKTAVFIMH